MTEHPIPPNSIDAFLAAIAKLDPQKYEELKNAVTGSSAFDRDSKRVAELEGKTGLTKKQLQGILSTLQQVYAFVHADDNTQEQANAELRDLIFSLDHIRDQDEIRDVIIQRVEPLLIKNDNIEHARKLARVKRGFIKNARGFDTIVELRPIFDSDRSKVLSLVPLIQFRIRTDERDSAPDREFVFQLDAGGLSKLEEAIGLARKKIQVLRAHQSLQAIVDEG